MLTGKVYNPITGLEIVKAEPLTHKEAAHQQVIKDLHRLADLNPIRDICTEVPNTASPKRRHN
jgi:hypothetical protein